MSDDESPFTYYGGPADGELVSFHPDAPKGFSAMLPHKIEDPERWPGGTYVLDESTRRYVWCTE